MIALPTINKDDRAKLLSKAGGSGVDPEVPLLIESLENYSGALPSTAFAVASIFKTLLPDWIKVEQTFAASTDCDAIEVANDLFHQGNLVLEGVAGSGKTHLITAIAAHLSHLRFLKVKKLFDELVAIDPASLQDTTAIAKYARDMALALGCMSPLVREGRRVTLIVLHPSSSYEELVIGLRPSSTVKKGEPAFRQKAGQLLKAILDASKSWVDGESAVPHLIVLDEINRCNLPAVLGELMLLVDSSRRLSQRKYEDVGELRTETNQQQCVEKGLGVRIPPLAELDPSDRTRVGDLVFLPDNIYILGTMNSSDRSILGFDQALRRRFPPKRIEPYTFEQWHKVLVTLLSTLDLRCLGILATEIVAWSALNAALRARIGPDAMVGHSYLFTCIAQLRTAPRDLERLANTLALMWQYDVLPQVIHAAESAREENFAQQLFEDSPSKGADWKGKETSLEETLAAVGVAAAHVKEFKTALVAHGVGSFSLARRHRIVNIGDRHGQRLLIEKRTLISHAYGGDWGSFLKAIDYASLNPKNQLAIIKACRLVDREDNGALTAKFPPPPPTANPTANPNP